MVPYLRLVHSAPPEEAMLNGRDLAALAAWFAQADRHGYCRMLVESGTGSRRPEDAGYVLLYWPGQDMAAWGLSRRGAAITVWECGTGADAGKFAQMDAALDSLPGAGTLPSRTRDAAFRKRRRS